MRALLEVIQFEIRYQLRSPFFLGALLMFALIHFLGKDSIFLLPLSPTQALAWSSVPLICPCHSVDFQAQSWR
jgi:hypothetical protein